MYICVGKIYYASYVCQEWVHFKGLQLPCSLFKKAFVWRISFLLFFFLIFAKLIFQTCENTRQTFVWFGVHRFVMVLEDSPRWLDHTVALWVLRLSCYQELRLTSDSWLTRGIAVLDLHWIILQWIVSSILFISYFLAAGDRVGIACECVHVFYGIPSILSIEHEKITWWTFYFWYDRLYFWKYKNPIFFKEVKGHARSEYLVNMICSCDVVT